MGEVALLCPPRSMDLMTLHFFMGLQKSAVYGAAEHADSVEPV
jgi:hypothetical protein